MNGPPPPGEPIRLVHCVGSLRVGGAERQLLELIRRLPREQYSQSLVLMRADGAMLDAVRAAGCEVVDLGYEFNPRKWHPLTYYIIARTLWRYVRHLLRRRPHILHARLYWANQLSVLAALQARFLGARVPVVITSRRQLSNYKRGRPLMQRLEDLANRATTAVVANSDAVRRDALAHERLDPMKIRVIYNGVVLEDYHAPDVALLRLEFGIREEEIVIVAVMNLHPYKGHEELIEATRRLVLRGMPLRLLLPGADRGHGEKLAALIRQHGLTERIHLAGERHDIPAFHALADIVVHSSHEEGFSNAILEAMTAGKPVIATNVGGNPEAVRDGENGLLVPVRDVGSLETALARLATDPALRAQLGKASRRRIEAEFSIEGTVRQFDAWYTDLLERRPIAANDGAEP